MKQTDAIYNLIKNHDVITIYGHGLPDGDCYGCAIGLRELIKETFPNKKVYALGSGLPEFFQTLSPMDDVEDEVISASLGILVDVSCTERAEDRRIALCKDVTKFDHHCPNPDIEPYPYPTMWVDEERIACAEMIAEFGLEYGMSFNKIAAGALYLGILTDSGDFIFHGTSQRTHDLASFLISKGAEASLIHDIAFHEDEATKAFRGYMGRRIKEEGQVAYLYLGEDDYLSQGMPYEKASEMVNALSPFTTKPIYALFTMDPHGEIRGELRSNKGYPVQPSATRFGGGGHLFASGLTLKHGPSEIKDVIKELNRVKPV